MPLLNYDYLYTDEDEKNTRAFLIQHKRHIRTFIYIVCIMNFIIHAIEINPSFRYFWLMLSILLICAYLDFYMSYKLYLTDEEYTDTKWPYNAIHYRSRRHSQKFIE